MDKVIANFNMTFNEGHFKKGAPYQYEENSNSITVITEEGKPANFTLGEFNILFSFLTF